MNIGKSIKAGLAAGVLSAAILTAGLAQAEDERVRWNMASWFPSNLTQLGTLGKSMVDRLDRISGGNIQIKFFEPNALIPAKECFDAVAAGSVDACWSTPGYWYGKEPALAMFAAVPFGPRAGEYLGWIYYGGGYELWDAIYEPHGLKSLPCGVIAPEASGWFRKEINSIEDLAGLKMRFFGLGAKVMEKIGVSTQLIAGGDIFPALERGSIDATEYSMPAIDLNLGLLPGRQALLLPRLAPAVDSVRAAPEPGSLGCAERHPAGADRGRLRRCLPRRAGRGRGDPGRGAGRAPGEGCDDPPLAAGDPGYAGGEVERGRGRGRGA